MFPLSGEGPMGLEARKMDDDAATRLLAAGRALLAQGDSRFSLTRLCAEAGVTLEEFRASFASKAALLQQLMAPQPAEKPEPPQADPWLERRLRVFERALGALEEKSERRDREYRQAIARLEEKLAEQGGAQLRHDVAMAAERALEAAMTAAPQDDAPQDGAPETPASGISMPETAPPAEQTEALPEALALAPLEPMGPPAKADSEFLQAGRRAAQAHARALARAPRPHPLPARLLLASVLAMAALLLCAVLTLGHADYARAAPRGEGTAHRATAPTPLRQLMARADSGDAAAARDLAFAYLRGAGTAKDLAAAARWAQAAADAGDAEAQYLAASLYRDGAGVPRDAARAFAWFARAAAAGQVKAMHNLAIAYLRGEGTAKDDAAGAAWFLRAAMGGYVDSAFDLAVLYEKGQGVTQDARAALRWYRAAAAAGDAQAAARARLLARQVPL
jgi:localization factor PodJL